MSDEGKIQELCNSLQTSKINSQKEDAFIESQKVFKKASSNQLLTLYLGSREIEVKQNHSTPITGIVFLDPKVVEMSQKVYVQLTLTFRYGREDEEVMGLKFCNEVIIALNQIWPQIETEQKLTPLQEILIERLGPNSIPFTIVIEKEIPASVQLLPAKRYTGSPIGTSYDLRVYAIGNGDVIDEKIQKRYTVRLGVRLIHNLNMASEVTLNEDMIDSNQSTLPRFRMKLLSPKARKLIKQTSLIMQRANSSQKNCHEVPEQRGCSLTSSEVENETKGPSIQMEKPFLWTDGRLNLKASLSKKHYCHGENVNVTLNLSNESKKVVRKIKILIVQFVDVCMFSNGKFKNIVAETEVNEMITPSQSFHATYSLLPLRNVTKNSSWIAVEGTLFSSSHHDASLEALNSKLASSTPHNAIYFTSKHIQQKNIFYERRKLPLRHHTIAHAHATDGEEEATSGSGCIGHYTEKNVFAINVSYYVKIKLSFSSIGADLSIKLPFILGNVSQECKSFENSQNKMFQKIDSTFTSDTLAIDSQVNTSYFNEELSSEKPNESEQSFDSSVSENLKRENVVEAQIHENKRKYLESDM